LVKANLTDSTGFPVAEEREHLQQRYPQQFPPGSIQPVAGDIRHSPPANATFDPGFGSDVVYYFI
jgi:hypothetical protein